LSVVSHRDRHVGLRPPHGDAVPLLRDIQSCLPYHRDNFS
jgi:hypothetical protein